MADIRKVLNAVGEMVQSDEFEQFAVDAKDFFSAREHEASTGTKIEQMSVPLSEAAEVVNRSFRRKEESGEYTNVICPVVIPKGGRSYAWVFAVVALVVVGLIGLFATSGLGFVPGMRNLNLALFGPHYWLLIVLFAAFKAWRNSFVMVPDGCKALITKFGKLEAVVDSGQTWIFHPWTKVSYIVNTTKEYPYNAPIREAPTAGRVNASVDLFLQFRVEEPSDFIFTLGAAQGFTEKLENAISEVTRALIYEQKADNIYDLVGESTQSLLDTLNKQFMPAVQFVNANITHAEPSNQQYRMDLAAPEMVRVAKEAYTYEYEIKLRKEQDEGDLNKELASKRETLSDIQAEIAKYQAQMDTAKEKEVNRANAYARQLLVEAESEAKANAALLEAQALDIRAMSSAYFPEILEYRFQQDVLDRLESIADKLPQMVHVGAVSESTIDFMVVAQQILGVHEGKLYADEDIASIRECMNEIKARIKERTAQINKLVASERLQGSKVDTEEVISEVVPKHAQGADEQAGGDV